jgi:hypothetical protein
VCEPSVLSSGVERHANVLPTHPNIAKRHALH